MMKSLLLILCCGFAFRAGAQKSQALRVNEIPESEAMSDTFHIGMACTYRLAGSKKAAFALASRNYSALVRIDGKDCWLKLTPAGRDSGHGPASILRYRNARYNVVLRMKRMADDTGGKGTMTVTDRQTNKTLTVAVEGGYEA